MKKRFGILIAACLTTLAAGLLFAGCTSGGLTMEEVEGMGFTLTVTFDAAGGEWSGGGTTDRLLKVKEGGKIRRNEEQGHALATREGYTFNTYWKGEKDEAGNITYLEPWDYENDRVTEDITLYARWNENYSLIAHYGENFARSKTFTVAQSWDGVAESVTTLSFTSENITVLQMYADETRETPIEISRDHPYDTGCTAENRVAHIYVDSLDGNFMLVRTAADLLRVNRGTNVYLLNDIDFEGEEAGFPDNYQGKFYGNGHKISNFVLNRSITARNDRYAGIFQTLQRTAEIKDVTFENFTLNVEFTNRVTNAFFAGALAGRAEAGAVIENVTLSGTFNCAIVSQRFEETDVEPFIGDTDNLAQITVTNCDYTAVTVNKTQYGS